MKNITLAVDEDVLAKVRRIAAEKDTSVNALVREYLTRMARREDQAAMARARLVELSEASEARIGDWKWDREELYDRGMLSRYEYSRIRSGGKEHRGNKKKVSE